MSLKLACPACRHVHFFGDEAAGQPASCEKCAQVFRVPRLVAEEPAPPPPPASAPWPWTGPLQARELPATFAPVEPLHAKVVPLPDEPISPRTWYTDDEDRSPMPSTSGGRHAQRSGRERPIAPPTHKSNAGFPWHAGFAGVLLVLFLFGAASAWFLMRDDRRPPPPNQAAWGGQPQFGGMPPQKVPAPQFQGRQQQLARKMPHKGERVPIEPQGNEVFVDVKLVKGQLQLRGNLGPDDAIDPVAPGCHRKVYLVELEAKRRYTFELSMDPPRKVRFDGPVDFRMYDPFLRIEDSQGNILEENDDINQGIDLNSRIPHFEIPAKGKYRVIVTSFDVAQFGGFVLNIRDEDRGLPVTGRVLPNWPMPQAAAVKQLLTIEKQTQNRLTITTVLKSEEPLVDDLCWSSDGAAFFVLDAQGVLRRIARDGFVEQARLELGIAKALAPPMLPLTKQLPRNLAMCRQGLLVGQPAFEEVWLLHPTTLAVQKRISAPGLRRVVAVPTQDYAWAARQLAAKPLTKEGIMVLDTVKGAPIQHFNFSPKNLAVTPDGKFLFAESGINAMTRYRLEDADVIREEESGPIGIADQGQGIFISPDSKYVCLSCRLGNHVKAVVPEVRMYTTYVFSVDNLQTPEFHVFTDREPRAFGFDPVSRSVFASNHSKQFLRYSMAGVKLLELTPRGAEGPAGEPRQFLTHPDGHLVLLRTERAIYQIELPKDEEK